MTAAKINNHLNMKILLLLGFLFFTLSLKADDGLYLWWQSNQISLQTKLPVLVLQLQIIKQRWQNENKGKRYVNGKSSSTMKSDNSL
ncbi:hypothetical protein CS542_10135 [Pedobacter sp. IW39]|nr:hypothetical protein CS542_10135 [Pedobacter sp. IW39]